MEKTGHPERPLQRVEIGVNDWKFLQCIPNRKLLQKKTDQDTSIQETRKTNDHAKYKETNTGDERTYVHEQGVVRKGGHRNADLFEIKHIFQHWGPFQQNSVVYSVS